jgi:integrase
MQRDFKPGDLLKRQEAAAFLSISPSTFDRHRPEPAFGGNGPLRWTFESLTRWRDGGEVSLAVSQKDNQSPDADRGSVVMLQPSRKNLYVKHAKGHTYYYHRPTKTKLNQPYDTQEFWQALAALNASMEPKTDNTFLERVAAKRVNPNKDTVSMLIDAYTSSPKHQRKAPNTKKLYDRYLGLLREHIGQLPMAQVDAAVMQALHDEASIDNGFRAAQTLISTAKLVFNWGNVYGWLNGRANPCNSIQKAARPRDMPATNRPWTEAEINIALLHLPKHLAVAVAIGAYTGLRKGDVINWTWEQYDAANGRIEILTAKQGVKISIPVHPRLKTILDDAKRWNGKKIVASARSPSGFRSASGFQASWETAKAKLEAKGLTGHLTFHGLRHTLATALAEAGCTVPQMMAVTGHSDPASVEHYIREASKKRHADAAFVNHAAWEAQYRNAERIADEQPDDQEQDKLAAD